MKFNEAIDKYLILQTPSVKESTIEYYNGKIPSMRYFLGDIDTSKIDKFVIAEFTVKLKERNPTISNRTLNYYRALVTRILRDVCDIFIHVKPLRMIKKVVNDLDDIVVQKILSHLFENRNDRQKGQHYYKYYFLIMLLLDTGVRVNELVNIETRNINYSDRAILLVVTKNDKQRYVFFTEETLHIMKIYLNRYSVDGPYLFPNRDNIQKHITKRAISKSLYNLKKRLNLEGSISPHKWRHTFATRYLRKEGSLISLQHLLGHEDIKTTMIYEHINKNDLQNMYNKVMK
jgi:site-specific recombinase XerD